jgi:hypothetical protein
VDVKLVFYDFGYFTVVDWSSGPSRTVGMFSSSLCIFRHSHPQVPVEYVTEDDGVLHGSNF